MKAGYVISIASGTGSTPAQTVEKLVPYTMEQVGKEKCMSSPRTITTDRLPHSGCRNT